MANNSDVGAARAALAAAAAQLADAEADFDLALDRGAAMPELRVLDAQVAAAAHAHAAARGAVLRLQADATSLRPRTRPLDD